MSEIYLPLHQGKAPYWLLKRMKSLAEQIVKVIVLEYGEIEFLRRISDPIFFQSFSNVLGFDWNSSGTTTVLTGVLKSVLNKPDFEIRVAGGKGANALKTPEEIRKFASELNVDAEKLINFSRISAKADNCALIDGYTLYHHAIFFTPKYFTVIQQGMNVEEKLARRYHWSIYENIPKLEDVHSGIISDRIEKEVVNMLSGRSREAVKTSIDIIRDRKFKEDYAKLFSVVKFGEKLMVPRKIDWKAVEKAYELQPERFEDLLLVRGIGRETIRALALISDLIYNAEYDKQDPAKYCFAVGGKDGVPFPVRRDVYDQIIDFMKEVLKQTDLESFEKKKAFERLWRSLQI
ncbi:MAG: DUF763 domain-containing protein [Archaeoglobaceae archaeon]|nr:DUF763 domain-containing protein [Archaeoglobaceae archaeon]MDW8128639.1 DUF763 domain-containing protein [Archaeoglobaceae archaeon]